MDKKADGQEFYPLFMDFLPEYFYQKAQKDLNETPETRKVELNKLNDLISAHKLMTDIEFEEDFLHQFLRHSKYNSTRAFRNLENYLTFRRNHSKMFQSVPDDYFRGNPSTECISILPYRCPDGCAIILGELRKWNPNELSLEYLKREFLAVFMQPLRCPMTQINGFKVIHDFKDSIKYTRFCTPQNLYMFYNAGFCCMPARYKEVHFINESVVLSAAWALLKHALTEKMRNRVFFHSKPEDLLNYFPKSIIPAQYGGSLVNYHDTEIMRKINKDHGNFPEGGQRNYY